MYIAYIINMITNILHIKQTIKVSLTSFFIQILQNCLLILNKSSTVTKNTMKTKHSTCLSVN